MAYAITKLASSTTNVLVSGVLKVGRDYYHSVIEFDQTGSQPGYKIGINHGSSGAYYMPK
jgi:hypothetical protein